MQNWDTIVEQSLENLADQSLSIQPHSAQWTQIQNEVSSWDDSYDFSYEEGMEDLMDMASEMDIDWSQFDE